MGLEHETMTDHLMRFDQVVGMIDSALAGDWLVGRHATIADVSVVGQLEEATRNAAAAAIIEARPRVAAWKERAAFFRPSRPEATA